MIFHAALFTLLALGVSTSPDPSKAIRGNSAMRRNLLRDAFPLESEHRFLSNDNERDMAYISQYSILYQGCSSYVGYSGDGIVRQENWVKFALCPGADGTCGSCRVGGPYNMYVVHMSTFLDVYTEYKMEFAEWQCEQIRENCDCENADDDEACAKKCYANAGLENQCMAVEGHEDFEVQRYLECAGAFALLREDT
jgi:hypothetical protein